MTEYKYSTEKIRKWKKWFSIISIAASIVIIILTIEIIILDLQINEIFSEAGVRLYGEDISIVISPVLFDLVVLFGIWLLVRWTEKSLSSYRLILGPDWIVRTQKGLPSIEIHASRISRLVEVFNRQLNIYTDEGQVPFIISNWIEGYSELRGALSRWRTIEAVNWSNVWKYFWKFLLAMLLIILAFPALSLLIFGSDHAGIRFIANIVIILSLGIISVLIYKFRRYLPRYFGPIFLALVLLEAVFFMFYMVFGKFPI